MSGGSDSGGVSDKKFYSILIITLIIMLGFGFLPTFSTVTPLGMKVLGVFIGAIFAWSMGELVWSSLMGLIILAVLTNGTLAVNYQAAFGNQTTGLVIASLVFCYAIERCGLLAEIAKWMVSRKWAQKSPWGLAIAFWIAAAVAGALATNVLPVAIILWALFYETAKEVGMKPYQPFAVIVMIGIVVVGYAGSAVMPYCVMALIGYGVIATVDPTIQMNNVMYLSIQLILAPVFIIMLVPFLRYVIRPKIDFELVPREPYKIVLTLEMKLCIMYVGILAAAMMLPHFLPQGNILRTFFNNQLGNLGILIGITVLMMLTRVKGKSLVDISEGLSRGVPWSLILLVSSALAISGVMVEDGTGIVPMVVNGLSPFVSGHSVATTIVIFCIIGLIATNFINDIVSLTVLLPIAMQFVTQAGGTPNEVLIMVALFVPATIQGCFMPSGSVLGALMHGNREWMTSGQVYKYVAIMEGVLAVAFVIVAPIVTKLFG